MKAVWRNVGHRISDILGLDRVGKAYHVLIVNYIFLVFYTTVEGVFINTLLYRISDGSMMTVIIYRGISYLSAAVFFHVSAYISQKKTPVIAARLGAIFYLIMYTTLFIWMDHMAQLQYLIAVLAGMGGSFYWAGHNVLIPYYTTKQNRDAGIAILGVIQGIMTLCIPVVSGFVISLMPGTTGYRVMFGVAMLAVIAQIFTMAKFHPVHQEKHRSEIRLAFKLLARKASYQLMMCYEFIRGIRDGTFAFILNILLFEIITDESIVGINTFLTGIMAIVGSWAYGRLVRPDKRIRFSVISVTALLLTGSMLFWKMNVATVMLYTVMNSFMQLFLLNSYNNTDFDILSQNKLARKCIAEMFAIREAPIALGRLVGLWFTTKVPPTQQGYVQVMLVLTVLQFIGVGLMQLARLNLERKKDKPLPDKINLQQG